MTLHTLFRAASLAALSFVPLAAHAQLSDMPVSGANSSIAASPAQIAADGAQRIQITVQARDRSERFLPGKTVTISVSNPDVIIIPLNTITDSMGRATFAVKSSVNGSAMVSAKIDGIEVYTDKTVWFTEPPACPLVAHELIKLADDGNPATDADEQIYYYGRDCKRHPFPGRALYSWYPEGIGASIVSAEIMASIKLGSFVDHKLGTLIRFQSDKRVYSAGRGGLIHETQSVDPAKEVDVLSDALYISYQVIASS